MKTNKKQLIISAFENLDAEMLDVLLNDDQSYMDVPKDVFIAELRKSFQEHKDDWNYKVDFKAFPGECKSCNKGKTGYSFINSDGECYMSMVFEESEEDFTDIYKCSCFDTYDKKIEEEWAGISFYEEDKVTYLPTEKNLRDQKQSEFAVKILEKELKNEGFLSSDFCINWFKSYKYLDDYSEIFDGKLYHYKKKVRSYLSAVSYIVELMKLNETAKEFFEEFCSFPVVNEEAIKDWLVRADHTHRHFKYGFEYRCDFRNAVCFDGDIAFDLRSLYYSQNISLILEKYVEWIPYPNPLEEEETAEFEFDDESEFPF